MARYDPFGRTEGMRRQVNDLILTAYSKGYNDGEHDEQDRKLEEKKGRWAYDEERGATGIYAVCTACNEMIYQTGKFNYCPNCGARMEE